MKRRIDLAGGCFWGLQKFFDQFEGVLSTEVGYANGKSSQTTYQEVCQGSGHAETVRIEYEDEKIELEQLMEYYFMVIDPFSINKQGNDVGIQYRTGIYYSDSLSQQIIEKFIDKKEKELGKEVAIEVGPILHFISAEEYHQKYLEKNPGGYCHIPSRFYSLSK